MKCSIIECMRVWPISFNIHNRNKGHFVTRFHLFFLLVTSPNYIDHQIIIIIWLKPLYFISALLLSACIPASLTSSLPPGSASPSPTRWTSLRVKAVFPAPLARLNVAVAEPVRTDLKQSRHTGESTYTYGHLFAFDRVTLVSPVPS